VVTFLYMFDILFVFSCICTFGIQTVAAVEGIFRSVLQRPRLPKNSSRKQHRLVFCRWYMCEVKHFSTKVAVCTECCRLL